MARAKFYHNDKYPDTFVAIKCEGCGHVHVMAVKNHPDFKALKPGDPDRTPVWGFNFNFDLPPFTPSLLVRSGIYVPGHEDWQTKVAPEDHESYIKNSSICHSFITDGRIQFLGDCTHSMANKTVDLPSFD